MIIFRIKIPTNFNKMNFSHTTLAIAITSLLSTTPYAQTTQTSSPEELLKLSTIIVKANEVPEIGVSRYNQEELQNTPNSSKSITDFLKVNPNVQFSNDHLAANTQANLKPNEISIHGAQTFQNKFMINGVSNTNILDPLGMGSVNYGQIESGSQGVSINTDLLCNLEVLDSNVSAKHGSFTGGVISADTCAPQSEIGKVHGSITYDYTSSNWVQYHQRTDADKGLYEGESTQGNQKEYTRQGLSTNIYSKLSDVYGINVYASQRRSEIPVESGLPSPKKIDQKKLNTNLGATLFANPNAETMMKFGFTLGNLEDNTYAEKRRNSHNTVKNDSILAFADISQQQNWGTLKQKINYQYIDNSRIAGEDRGINWQYAAGSKDWNNTATVWEGASSASIDLTQNSLNYELDALFNTVKIGNTAHKIITGLAYQRDDVKWQRTKDFATHYGIISGRSQNLFNLNGEKCQPNDLLCDENPTSNLSTAAFNGQYFKSGSLYKVGEFSGTYQQISAYIEDEMQWKNLKTRFGVRVDYDEANKNLNFAPRSNISYQPFGNHALTFVSGWSRYYSAPTYITDLHQSLTNFDFSIDRKDQNSPWIESPNSNAASTRRKDLKTPYADEFVLGISGEYKNTWAALKWVNRQYKDEVSRNKTDIPAYGFNYSYEFGNNGYGKNDSVTLEIGNIHPLKFKSSNHDLTLAINYSDTSRGTPDYTSNYIEDTVQRLISYNGEIISYADRPAENYNKPMTARLTWDIGFDTLPLHITNFIRYTNSYDRSISSANKVIHDGVKLDTYTFETIKPSFSWDIKGIYDIKIAKDYAVALGLTINNLTDRNNQFASNGKLYSEIGRQFIADITFKF